MSLATAATIAELIYTRGRQRAPPARLARGPAPLDVGSINRRSAGNVTPLRPRPAPFDQLTATLVVAQFRQGTLPEAVLLALLACAGLQP